MADHGGVLEVSSREGICATVGVLLPAWRELHPSILVIDDEESVRFTFENLLNDNGYRADSAADFESSLKMIRSRSYDLVFSDIFLRGNTGIDILREIRETDGWPIFVFMTGHPHMETAMEALRLGAFDYIPKPFKSDTVLRVVRMALQHKALTR